MHKTIRTAAAVALFATSAAQADVVSFESGLPIAPSTKPMTLTLGLFDPSQGTLTGASLTLARQAQEQVIITNTLGTINFVSLVQLTVKLDLTTSLSALDPYVGDITNSYTTSNVLFQAGETKTFTAGDTTGTTEVIDLAAILDSLEGIGNFSISCRAVPSAGVSGGGGFSEVFATTSACGANVTYTYTPSEPDSGTVPEPGSLVLASMALAGVGAASRRRRM